MVKILYFDDNDIDIFLLGKILEGTECSMDGVSSFDDFWKLLNSRNYDLVLIDLYLGNHNGDEICTKAKSISSVPLYITSGMPEFMLKEYKVKFANGFISKDNWIRQKESIEEVLKKLCCKESKL